MISPGVLVVVLAAAAAHAAWNAMAKAIPDRLAAAALIALAYLLVGVVGVLLAPPMAPAAVPFAVASAAAQVAYLLVLTAAYRVAPFATAYPLARGTAVALVTLASVLLLGEPLTAPAAVGVVLLGAAVLGFALRGGTTRLGLALALLTGSLVATYTLLDGVGVRRAHEPATYAAWLFLGQGAVVPPLAVLLARRSRTFWPTAARSWPVGLLGGLLSSAAYGAVVWAQSRATLALVSALRESSVVLAAILSAVVFRERLTPLRAGLVLLAAGGIAVIRLA